MRSTEWIPPLTYSITVRMRGNRHLARLSAMIVGRCSSSYLVGSYGDRDRWLALPIKFAHLRRAFPEEVREILSKTSLDDLLDAFVANPERVRVPGVLGEIAFWTADKLEEIFNFHR